MIPIVWSSCASLLNKPTVGVNFHTNKELQLIFFKDTIQTINQHTRLNLPRAISPFEILAVSDSLQHKITLHSKNSTAYDLNLLFSSWIGMYYEKIIPKDILIPKTYILKLEIVPFIPLYTNHFIRSEI